MDCEICENHFMDSFIDDSICDNCCLMVAKRQAFQNALKGELDVAVIWTQVAIALKA